MVFLCSLSSPPLCHPYRSLKKKSSSGTKRLSPAPQLGPASDTHTSYYSESVVRESYIGSPRAASLARSALLDSHLRGEPYWSEWPRSLPHSLHPHTHLASSELFLQSGRGAGAPSPAAPSGPLILSLSR